MNQDALSRLLTAARRRLWWEAALRQAHVALWCGGAMMLLAAVTGIWIPSIDTGLAAGLGAIVALMAATPVLSARPTPDESALRLDRYFSGHALITTALETLSSQSRRSLPPARALLDQASAASAAWLPRVGGIWRRPPAAGFALALLPIACSLLLLEATGASPAAAVGAGGSVDAGLHAHAIPAAAATTDVRDLRAALAAARDAEPAARRSSGTTPAAPPPDSRPDGGIGETAQTAVEAPGRAGSGGGREAGDALPGETTDGLPDESPTSRDVRFRALARTGDAAVSMTGDERGYLTGGHATGGGSPTPAAAPPGGTRSLLTNAEIAYARRYLTRRND